MTTGFECAVEMVDALDETRARHGRRGGGVPDSDPGAGEQPDGLLLSWLLSGSVSTPLMLEVNCEVDDGEIWVRGVRDPHIPFWNSLILVFVACRGPPFGPRFWRVWMVVHWMPLAWH